MLDWVRACKGGDPGCADFSITAPYAEWLSLLRDDDLLIGAEIALGSLDRGVTE